MAIPTITENLQYPPGVSAKDVAATVALRGNTTDVAPGAYVTRSGLSVGGRRRVRFDTPGALGQLKDENGNALTLHPNLDAGSNDAITTPVGSFYEYRVTFPGRPDWVRYLSIPDTAGPFRVDQVLVSSPATIPSQATSLGFTPTHPIAPSTVQTQAAIDRHSQLLLGTPCHDALREFWRAFWDLVVNGTPLVLGLGPGDSVTEGFNGSTSAKVTWPERVIYGLRVGLGFALGGIGHRHASPISYLTPRWTTGAGVPALNSIGLGLNSSFLPYGATQTLTTQASAIQLFYNRWNNATNSYLELVDSVAGVITGGGLDTNDGATAFPGRCNAFFSFDFGASANRTITIRCKADGVKTAGATFCNTNLLDNENAANGRVVGWNAGKFGSTSADHLFGFNTDALATANARLVIFALGLNETNATTMRTNLGLLKAQIDAQYVALARRPPSYAAVISWARGGALTRNIAANQPWVEGTWQFCEDNNIFPIETDSLIGDGSTDAAQLLTDGIHPSSLTHNGLGYFILNRLLAGAGIRLPPGTWETPAGGSVATDTIWDAVGDLAVGTGADTAARLAKGTQGQILTVDTSTATDLAWADGPWLVPVPYTAKPYATTGTWALYAAGALYLNAGQVYDSTPAINNYIAWKVHLAAGTWTFRFLFDKTAASGISTVSLGGSTIATVDAYNGSTTRNNESTTTGIVVAATGVYELKFLQASKNASSSNYGWYLNAMDFTRTA